MISYNNYIHKYHKKKSRYIDIFYNLNIDQIASKYFWYFIKSKRGNIQYLGNFYTYLITKVDHNCIGFI